MPSTPSWKSPRRGAAALSAALIVAMAAPVVARAEAPAPAFQASLIQAAPSWTRVRVVSPDARVALEWRAPPSPGGPEVYSTDVPWKRVCVGPCEIQAPIAGEYRFAGEGITPSSSFAVRGPTMDLHVSPGSAGMRRAGTYMAVFGFLAAAVGGVLLAINAVGSGSKDTSAKATHGTTIVGAAAAIGGGSIGLAGVALVLVGGTSVRDERRQDVAHRPQILTVNATLAF
jgi:hypothetical protein